MFGLNSTVKAAFAAVAALVLSFGAANAAEVRMPTSGANAELSKSFSMPQLAKKETAKNIVVARRRGRRGRRRGAAIALGILGVVGAVAAAKAAERSYRRDRRYRRQCRRWLRRCERGNDRACYRFEDNC
ncbi:MAG: hypothetical protein AAFV26_09565 [Pseudomonadota bacterium]